MFKQKREGHLQLEKPTPWLNVMSEVFLSDKDVLSFLVETKFPLLPAATVFVLVTKDNLNKIKCLTT